MCLESSCALSASILSPLDTSKPWSQRQAVLAASQGAAYSLTQRLHLSWPVPRCPGAPEAGTGLQKSVQIYSQSSTRNLHRQAHALSGYFRNVYVRIRTVAADITQACVTTTPPWWYQKLSWGFTGLYNLGVKANPLMKKRQSSSLFS